jgi:hypothetical protein
VQWNHEADLYLKNVPKILVGCKKDISYTATHTVWTRDVGSRSICHVNITGTDGRTGLQTYCQAQRASVLWNISCYHGGTGCTFRSRRSDHTTLTNTERIWTTADALLQAMTRDFWSGLKLKIMKCMYAHQHDGSNWLWSGATMINYKISNGICRCRFSYCNALYTCLHQTTIEGKASRWLKAQTYYLLQADLGHPTHTLACRQGVREL